MWILIIAASRRYMDYDPTDELCSSMFHVLKLHFDVAEKGLCKDMSIRNDGKKNSSDATLGCASGT